MQLYELLRHITVGSPIILFDLQGNQICTVRSKNAINLDLYESDVIDIGVGQGNILSCSNALYITIVK